MKIQELRVGNYIYENNKILQITDGHNFDAVESWLEDTDFIKPILITEHILLKLGFKIGVNNYDCGNYHIISKFGEFYLRKSYKGGFYWGFDYDNEINNVNNVEYIHQLQNLYYVITGCELTISES